MGVATEPPGRLDLSFFDDDDKVTGALWLAGDGTTPITVTAAKATLQFDDPRVTWVDGEPQPLPPPVRHVVDSTDPADPDGHFFSEGFAQGVVMFVLPREVWPGLEVQTTMRRGRWDLVATSTSALDRVLLRGLFTLTAGIDP